jgi:uncharacterized lipoprotein YehR (DUF1307 family)
MEKQTYVTKEELDKFVEKLDEYMRQIRGIKSTIEILQDKEAMEMIKDSEELETKGEKLRKINI